MHSPLHSHAGCRLCAKAPVRRWQRPAAPRLHAGTLCRAGKPWGGGSTPACACTWCALVCGQGAAIKQHRALGWIAGTACWKNSSCLLTSNIVLPRFACLLAAAAMHHCPTPGRIPPHPTPPHPLCRDLPMTTRSSSPACWTCTVLMGRCSTCRRVLGARAGRVTGQGGSLAPAHTVLGDALEVFSRPGSSPPAQALLCTVREPWRCPEEGCLPLVHSCVRPSRLSSVAPPPAPRFCSGRWSCRLGWTSCSGTPSTAGTLATLATTPPSRCASRSGAAGGCAAAGGAPALRWPRPRPLPPACCPKPFNLPGPAPNREPSRVLGAAGGL